MTQSAPEHDFESELAFHRTEWRVQRVGWIVLALFLLLALGGLFGSGPLSHVRTGNSAGRIEYERFVRNGTPTNVVVTATTDAARGISRVEITASYLEAFRIERITPEPTSVRIDGRQLLYEFASAAPGAAISLHILPQRPGRHSATVRIDGGAPLQLRQFTYP